MGDHLVTRERKLGPVWQLREEEPDVEPAADEPRRHPARERPQPVGPQLEIELVGDLADRRPARQEPPPSRLDGIVGRRRAAWRDERDPCLLPQFADRCHVRGQGLVRIHLAGERRGSVRRRAP